MKKLFKKKLLISTIIACITISVVFLTIIMVTSNVYGAGKATYDISNDWGSGAVINVSITNSDSSPIDGWTVKWTFAGNQKISNMWNASYTQNGNSVEVSGVNWNSVIPAKGSVNFGFQITYSGTNSVPSDISVNGKVQETAVITAKPTAIATTQVPKTQEPTTQAPKTDEPTTAPTTQAPTSKPTSVPSNGQPDGYAASAGTTGGGNSSPITVSSASEFKSAVKGNDSKVIIVNGRFNLGGNVSIGSNKTIMGANSSSGLYNGTVLVGGSNYIFKNLTFGPSAGDVMEMSGATKVFITKSTFHDSTDELCSVVRQSDYVTISWSKFYFDNPDSHSFASLIGNSDTATGDRGKLHVTMHHNWYSKGVRGRMPRVRFGYVHLYNNYYNGDNGGYSIGVGKECHIRLENTHFNTNSAPWADYGGTSDGQMGWSNLKFEGSKQPTFVKNSFPVFSPPYSYDMDPVNNVAAIVKAGAGNVSN